MRNLLLLIIDGLGLRDESDGNAFFHANAPFLKSLLSRGVYSRLKTYGPYVGLPSGQMGNSEVGHMNLGAGRVVKQQQVLLDEKIEDESLFKNLPLKGELHVVGLVSSGGVHSHIRHLEKIDSFFQKNGSSGFLHIITDGRDTPPRSFLNDWSKLNLKALNPATIIGRYYAMDRDKRWERTQRAYDLIVFGKGEQVDSVYQAIELFYSKSSLSDEFLDPFKIGDYSGVKDPTFLFFNFREDRMRQLASALCEEEFAGNFKRERVFSSAYSLVELDKSFKNITSLLKTDVLNDTLGEIVSEAGFRQLRAAETEKYPHVTYFFNGGREKPFDLEERLLIQSPRDVPTYDHKPEMSVFELTEKVVKLLSPEFKLAVINFANCDMVGHTGSFEAAIRACEAVDKCARELVTKAAEIGFWSIITADHGNCEEMMMPDGSPHTAHTLNDVFFIILDEKMNQVSCKQNGLLGSVAPTALQIIGIPKPEIMLESLLV